MSTEMQGKIIRTSYDANMKRYSFMLADQSWISCFTKPTTESAVIEVLGSIQEGMTIKCFVEKGFSKKQQREFLNIVGFPTDWNVAAVEHAVHPTSAVETAKPKEWRSESPEKSAQIGRDSACKIMGQIISAHINEASTIVPTSIAKDIIAGAKIISDFIISGEISSQDDDVPF